MDIHDVKLIALSFIPDNSLVFNSDRGYGILNSKALAFFPPNFMTDKDRTK